MKKFTLLSKNEKKVLNENEMMNFVFEKLANHLYTNIESKYDKLRKDVLFSKYGNYYKKRSQVNHKCYEAGCNKPPIFSHSISKNAVLKNIASNGLVYTPSVTVDGIIMDSVGIETQASVFPGFCKNHDENLFSELDRTNNIEYTSTYFDQLTYRTIIREIYCLERNIRFSELMMKDLKKGFQTTKKDVIDRHNSTIFSSKYKILDWKDSRYSINDQIESIKTVQEKNTNILAALIDFYQNQGPYLVTFSKIKYTLPVAISGFTNFISNKKKIHLIINCLPYEKHTLFSFVTTTKDRNLIKNELLSDYDLSDSDSLLKLIEIFSVKGTDNIFFDIKYWDKLDKSIVNKFIQDFSDFKSSDPRDRIDYSFLQWDYKSKNY